jgi:hypothetical protein
MCLAKTVAWNGMPCKSSETNTTPATFSQEVSLMFAQKLSKKVTKTTCFNVFQPFKPEAALLSTFHRPPLWHRIRGRQQLPP